MQRRVPNDLVLPIDHNWMNEVGRLVSDVPSRHSRYQIEHFMVCRSEWPADRQYKQCLRELDVRHKLVREREFEFTDYSLKIEELYLNIEKEKASELTPRVLHNKIKQIENQINLLRFKMEVLTKDTIDVMREMKILHELAIKLEDQRKFQSIEDADNAYWASYGPKLIGD